MDSSEKRFRALTENASDIISIVDAAGVIVYRSPATERWLGYSAQELIGWSIFDLMHPDDAERARQLFQEVIQQPGAVRCDEVRIRARDGSWRVHEAVLQNLLHDPAVQGVVVNSRDITDRKHAEQVIVDLNKDLQRRLTELETLFDTVPIGIGIADDPQCSRIHGNAAFAEMLGQPIEANLSKSAPPGQRPENFRAMQDGRELAPEELPMQRAARGVPVIGAEFDVVHNDGRVVRLLGNATPLFDEQGKPRGVIAAFMDIYELKKTEQRLEEAKVEAEAANQAKSQFLANVSHELRTPLTVILGFAELLARGGVPEEKNYQYLSGIQRHGLVLLQLIDDVLDLSKIAGDKIAIHRVDVSPWRIIDEVLSLTRPQAIKKQLDLQVEYGYPLPETIQTDPLRLRQILVNLVGNAVKFTEHGSVRITVSCPDRHEPSPRLRVAVCDTGIGISPEGIDKLFQPFTQVDSSVARRFGGAGLGLALSRRLVRLLGGDIEVVSQVGQGSTFTLTLEIGPLDHTRMLDAPPGLPASARWTAAEPAQRFQGRVLLAEDDPDSREVVRAMLQNAGLAVDEVENGQMAFRRILSAAAERPYDLILMDMQMPGMDGYQATRRLRSTAWKGIVIALTAHAMSGDREKCLEAGCNDYLCKPITGNALTALLARYLPPQAGVPGPACDPGEALLRQPGALDDASISAAQRSAMLAKFVQRLSKRRGEIDRALGHEDRALLEQAAHRLAGAAALFGFPQISHSARMLEEHAQQRTGFDVLAADARALTDLCQRVTQTQQADAP